MVKKVRESIQLIIYLCFISGIYVHYCQTQFESSTQFQTAFKLHFRHEDKSMFTFQIDIRNQIDLHFYFNIIFHLMSRFIDQVWFISNTFVLKRKLKIGRCQEKIPPEKDLPPWRVRGRVRVRLGIGLGLESGGLFSGGIFS